MSSNYKNALKILLEITDETTAKHILSKLEHLKKTYEVKLTLEDIAKYYINTVKKIEHAGIEKEDAIILAYAYVENSLSSKIIEKLPENYESYLKRLTAYIPDYTAVKILNKLLYSMKMKNLDVDNQTAVNHVLDEIIDIRNRLIQAKFPEPIATDIALNVVLDKLSYIYKGGE